jgi:uncharacterized protein
VDPKTHDLIIVDNGNGDEPLSNHSNNPTFAAILEKRLSRRDVLRGSLSVAVVGMFGASLVGCNSSSSSDPSPTPSQRSLLGFSAIPVSDADDVRLPPGYSYQVLIPWGEPITGNFPPFDPLTNTGADQGNQVGSHHDGMHFFPIEGQDPYEGSSVDGLLVLNHEYVEPRYMHASAVGKSLSRDAFPVQADGTRVADEILTEMNGHGVSIVRIAKQANGQWAVVADARNRRITALTPMEFSGPVRGSDLVKTPYSPNGTRTRGTINNCAHGVTPWNTYLTCEENWAGYFVNRGERPREQSRYGVSTRGARYGWDLADNGADEYVRFDVTAKAASAVEDYRNEPNGQGWVVEIDPFAPDSTPVKRTALGRFAHEGVVFARVEEGKPVVCYSGDDAINEYIYKFVSAQPYFKATAGGHLLDSGTLYVAQFNDDGTGEWLPLVFGAGPLSPIPDNQGDPVTPGQIGFASQADVLVNTRLAADAVGATKMDRPEWGAVDPKTGRVYFTLTNNTARTADQVDAANPRPNSRWGHIIRWEEGGGNPTATTFNWDIFILAGPPEDSQFDGQSLTADQFFNSPDGLWFDKDSRLWIQTDISESVMNTGDFAQFGNNQMLACDPVNKDLRRFLTGPLGQEVTGVITTPDQKTMFMNLQHPGATTTPEEFAAGNLKGTWPHNARYGRSATVVITKDDGGVIGT